MFAIFVAIAIFIACMGLFGLAAFTAGRRTKEIGIRKVFGARMRDVVFLLLWQFSVPVLVANLIAWPVAWYYLHGWLQGFAYRIPLSPLYFVGAGAVALVIAWATVFVHALRVAALQSHQRAALRVGPMFSNYLIIALRNIVRHKLYSFINIAGLAVGLACAIFIDPVCARRAVLRQMDSRAPKSLSASS